MKKNILILYDKYSTYTNAVFDHLEAFRKYSKHHIRYLHALSHIKDEYLTPFDILVVHYSVRVAFYALSQNSLDCIARFQGGKILFIQDEYDHTERTRQTISTCGFDIVFTCVPERSINEIYPSSRFPRVKFVTNLTGYAAESSEVENRVPISDRNIDVGYRGRVLPFWYGSLGQEKRLIAEGFLKHARVSGLRLDISCQDSDRLYGEQWNRFLSDCRVTLGSESGCNIFDYDGSLRARVATYLKSNESASFEEVSLNVFGAVDEVPIMNQISPRIFEAAAHKTALILFEGNYSGLLKPWVHYIPLKKDFSNIQDVIKCVQDVKILEKLSDKCFQDLIVSGKYSFRSFINDFDRLLDIDDLKIRSNAVHSSKTIASVFTTDYVEKQKAVVLSGKIRLVWDCLPLSYKEKIKPLAISVLKLLRG